VEPHAAGKGAAGRARRRRGAPDDWRVEVDRFTRLTALASYLLTSCGDDEITLDSDRVCRDLAVTKADLKADVRLLNVVNFGGDGSVLYAEFKGARLHVTCDLAGPALSRPARLSPLQADTLLLAIDLVGGRLPTSGGSALRSAETKIRAARWDTAHSVENNDLLPPDEAVLDKVNAAITGRRLLRIDYWKEGTETVTTRTVEPYLLVHSRGEWYYVCWCRTAGGTRVFRVATTRAADLLDETFTPRGDVELELYRREGIPTSGEYAPRTATLWYSAEVSRWVEERQPVQRLADGSCLAEQPYVDVGWLTHLVLRFGDKARVLAPADAAGHLRATVGRLLALYG
jgi:proteasome accessory factor C